MIKKQITVRELIEQLQTLPPDLPVQSEGCDCCGAASGAEVVTTSARPKDLERQDAYVLITRLHE